MKKRPYKRLNPEELRYGELVALAVSRELIVWYENNPDPSIRMQISPARQYRQYVYLFNHLVTRELKNKVRTDAEGLLEQINLNEEESATILEFAGIGYPLPIAGKPR